MTSLPNSCVCRKDESAPPRAYSITRQKFGAAVHAPSKAIASGRGRRVLEGSGGRRVLEGSGSRRVGE